MVCVDEVNLFTHFRMTFHNKFKELTSLIFDKLKVAESASKMKMKIHILLFMTVSCTKSMLLPLSLASHLIPMSMCFGLLLWKQNATMYFLRYNTQPQSFNVFKKKVCPQSNSQLWRSLFFILTRVLRIPPKICDWIGTKAYKAVVLKMLGC
jgi:hypothetical protein